MVKYNIEYKDVENVSHKLEIYDAWYFDAEIQIKGRVYLDYALSDSALTPIRASGMKVELEADPNLTFDDLYSEKEMVYKTTYYRDGVVKFIGWINSEGWFEDFVKDKWIISFSCTSGLGSLKNLGYVDDDGKTFVGKQTVLEVITHVLKRTELKLNINTDIDIHYSGMDPALNMLDNAKINTERYIKTDGYTTMSCFEVLKSVLDMFTACITLYNGEWFIYRPNKLF